METIFFDGVILQFSQLGSSNKRGYLLFPNLLKRFCQRVSQMR